MLKKFNRIKKDSRISGVCAGLGERWSTDPAVFRIAFVALSLVWGLGLWIYIYLSLVTPLENGENIEADKKCQGNAGDQQKTA